MRELLRSFLKSKVSHINEAELTDLVEDWHIVVKLNRGEALGSIKTDTNIYYINKGAVKIGYLIDDREVILEFGYKGICIFNLPTFFDESYKGYYIEALQRTEMIGISKSDFYKHLANSKTLSDFWRSSMEKLLLNFVEREIDILSQSPQIRYHRLISRNPQLLQFIPKKYIAQYLGLSAETLSRLQKS